MKKIILALIVISIIILGSIFFLNNYQKIDSPELSNDVPVNQESEQVEKDKTTKIQISNHNLEALNQGSYEGWVISGEDKHSTGKFNVGDLLNFDTDVELNEIDSFVVTVEPEGDEDIIPSGIAVLVGDLVSGQKEIDLSFPVDLSSMNGTYILGTPTDGNSEDETSGVWFVDITTIMASLDLPELPDGWIYEGWTVYEGKALTIGRFSDPTKDDLFNLYSGTEAKGPGFPGEDYLLNAPSGLTFPAELANGTSVVVVSVEPNIMGDDPTGPSPFSIKPLAGMIPEGAKDHFNYDLIFSEESIPSAVVKFN